MSVEQTSPAALKPQIESNEPASSAATTPKLFVRDSEPLKFFIQRDTGANFISWLVGLIVKYGGTVVNVVPLSGYVLIDPETETGERLLKKWDTTPERPNRHVVSYTFIRASIVAEALIPPEKMRGVTAVFRDNSAPVEIWVHPSLDEEERKKAQVDIEKYGGVTDTDEESARVIIAPHTTKQQIVLWNDLIKRHDNNEAKFIEDLDWVYRCIDQNKFEKTSHRKRNLGGRKPGAKRIEYTKEDDENLVKYIAEKIPYAETGGRLGNNLYTELENNASEYPWAHRHSWHSWRNRYKTRQLIFDVAVRDYVAKHPPPDAEAGSLAAHPQIIPLADDGANTSTADKRGKGKEKAKASSTGGPKKRKSPSHADAPARKSEAKAKPNSNRSRDKDVDEGDNGMGLNSSTSPHDLAPPKKRVRRAVIEDSESDS